jgi:hypothetical protein
MDPKRGSAYAAAHEEMIKELNDLSGKRTEDVVQARIVAFADRLFKMAECTDIPEMLEHGFDDVDEWFDKVAKAGVSLLHKPPTVTVHADGSTHEEEQGNESVLAEMESVKDAIAAREEKKALIEQDTGMSRKDKDLALEKLQAPKRTRRMPAWLKDFKVDE